MTTAGPGDVSPEERERTMEAIAKLKSELAAAKRRPRRPGVNAAKFHGSIGLDDDGNPQAPLTAAERRRKEEWRRRAQGNSGSEPE
ncbi:hypothetical protein [Jiangella alba]|uniref:Uncharacterized protein n=1 Tax=Jiangella alba TaxID=561176 RepID=A0A1H5PA11_9ACTN|nr:hypothetical protein [Jiangella alba]SEF10656.1 hypothetical protein SAMN04488561_3967 [Jiangella alba]